MARALCLGELLVDMVSDADAGLAEAPGFLKAPGGAPANVAVGLARLDVECGFLGAVGDDPFGHWLRGIVAAEGVGVDGLKVDAARTTIAFVATRKDGKKDICFYRNPGADAQFAVADLTPAMFEGLDLFHCGSVSLSLEPCREAQFEAARRARAAGALVSFDPNWRPSLWDDHGLACDLIWRMFPLCDIVKVADEEWEFLTGTADLAEGAAKIRALGPKIVVVTRGADGAWFASETESGEVAGLTVDAIDTLGAGDAFVAGLLSEVLRAPSLDAWLAGGVLESVRFANACGAFATLGRGAIPGLPRRADAEGLLTG